MYFLLIKFIYNFWQKNTYKYEQIQKTEEQRIPKNIPFLINVKITHPYV